MTIRGMLGLAGVFILTELAKGSVLSTVGRVATSFTSDTPHRSIASDTLTAAQQFELQAQVTEAYRALSALGALLTLPPDAAEST